jgi:hypothetical protein
MGIAHEAPGGRLAGGDRLCLTSELGGLGLGAFVERTHRYDATGMAVASLAIDMGLLSRVGRALADATRRRVLVELLDGPAYPTDLAEAFGTTRANLSNHLTSLRDCGLVTATAEDRRLR